MSHNQPDPDLRPLEPYQKEGLFINELDSLTSHFSQEYEMTYAQIIGCLTIFKGHMEQECRKQVSQEQDEEHQG